MFFCFSTDKDNGLIVIFYCFSTDKEVGGIEEAHETMVLLLFSIVSALIKRLVELKRLMRQWSYCYFLLFQHG